MWTCGFARFCQFTNVTRVHKYARSCMFVRECLLQTVVPGAGNHNCETFARNENVISPKNLRPSPAIEAGAGYARPMQALSLASQALPDLRLRPSPAKEAGAGYAWPMQAFSLASRALPDLRLRPSPAMEAGAGYARPMQALSLASQALPDLRLRPSPLATKKAVPFDTA